jgi:hypothetical protein
MDVEGDDTTMIYFNRRRRRAIRRRPRKNINKSGDKPSGDSVSVEIIGKHGSKRKNVVSSSYEEDDENDGCKINNAPTKSFAEIQKSFAEFCTS